MEARRPRLGSAFLLAQVGAHAAQQFTERMTELDLTPAQVGLLRLVASRPGQSQQSLAKQLGTPATRLVPLVDGLEKRGLIERRRNAEDRRLYAVEPSEDGRALLGRIGQAGAAHEQAVTAALTDDERDVLHGLLVKIADQQGLTPGVHPGYLRLRS
ncbi:MULTISPECIES: MarR family winged helix-turn-helix transcriptional regulator [unclassified Amycolatopsis]|uniref:MarR family winged helix-turn-helix transcriptional regulator n=1 Tax=unclassified Amycolatopsis TaxID=2618356 RepID=UPI002E0E83F0|nr:MULTISPECIES: MarR family transcriptional regulator [unclassified Amycolatopsis]WSJ75817.1 MarR family transcriptional regulator [Amycolatopsis sp. NBC_01307]WSK80584.1 MarR family transcriptional regulator [Amycolatopsis sp. NBC_01286]